MADEVYYHSEITFLEPERPPHLVRLVNREASLDLVLSDGQVISYPRKPLEVGTLTSSFQKVGERAYRYEYVFDNSEVENVALVEISEHTPGLLLDLLLDGPAGWTTLGIGWSAAELSPREEPVARSRSARYAATSHFLPGPECLRIMGPENFRADFQHPFNREDMGEQILIDQLWMSIQANANSVNRVVIGPVFRPEPTEQEIRERIHLSVHRYGLDFLRTLDDAAVDLAKTAESVVATTDLEKQILDCLKGAIRVMVDDPAVREKEAQFRARVEICKTELVRRCAVNLDALREMKLMWISLSEEECQSTLSAENWEFKTQQKLGPAWCRSYQCLIGKHELQAVVWTDDPDKSIGRVTIGLFSHVDLRQPDGVFRAEKLTGPQITLQP